MKVILFRLLSSIIRLLFWRSGYKRSFRYKLFDKFVMTLLRFNNGHSLVGGFIGLTAIRLSYTSGLPTVLCISRDRFDRDILELSRRTGDRLNWIYIRTTHLSSALTFWMPEPMRHQTRYATHKDWDKTLDFQKSLIMAEALLNMTRSLHGVSVVLSANIDYWQDASLKEVCARRDIPFLVQDVETPMCEAAVEDGINYWRELDYKFRGDGIAVFSEWTKSSLVESGTVCADAIQVTGSPRFDAWRNIGGAGKSSSISMPKKLILVSFGLPDYHATESFRSTLKTFAEESVKAPSSVKFIVRAKNAEDEQGVNAILATVPGQRVITDVTSYMHTLITGATSVIGFNSTVLVEALLSDVDVHVIRFGDAELDRASSIFHPQDPLAAETVNFITNEDGLRESISQATGTNPSKSIKYDRTKRNKLLRQFLHYDEDRSASDKVADFILSYIQE